LLGKFIDAKIGSMLENKNKEGDELYVAGGGRCCNVYKVLTSKVELLCRKNAKAENKKKLQELQWK